MNFTELNKIAAAVACAAAALGVAIAAGAVLVPAERPARPAFAIEPPATAKGAAPAGSAAVAASVAALRPPGIDALLKTASAQKGQATAGQLCAACHSFEKGGEATVGPNLYGAAGASIASKPDFDYSDALKSKGGRWTPERLDAWLTKPRDFAPGTRMGFAGIADDATRADVIAYLISLGGTGGAAAPAASSPAQAQPPAGAPTFAALVEKADIKQGQSVVTDECSACHSLDKGGSAMVGPNLWGVVGRPVAHTDYAYSAALSAKGGAWTVERLGAWLESPRAFAAGTKMVFPGIAGDGERAAVVAYLRTLKDAK